MLPVGLSTAAQLHEARGHHREVGEHVAGAEQCVKGLQGLAHWATGLDRVLVAPFGGQVPSPGVFEGLDLAGRLLAVVLGKEHAVGGVAVERRVEVHEVDRLAGDVAPQDVEVVAVIQEVRRAVGPRVHDPRLPSGSDGGRAPNLLYYGCLLYT